MIAPKAAMTFSRPALTILTLLALASCAPGGLRESDAEETDDDSEELKSPFVVGPDCADPGVLRDGDTIYVVCTGRGFKLFSSDSPKGPFELEKKIFPEKSDEPSWADRTEGSHWWAPEIHKVNGKFVLYFTATRNNRHVIGAAWADSPTGPFHNTPAPLVEDDHSEIDATELSWHGRQFLYWKSELFENGHQADVIRARELADDGLSFKAGTVEHTVLRANKPWEGGVVEGPWLFKSGEQIFMFYSGNAFCNPTYGIGVARADRPLADFQRETVGQDGLILGSGDRWLGPGHNAVVRDKNGKAWTLFHAYDKQEGPPKCGQDRANDNNRRHLLAAPVNLDGPFPEIRVQL